MNFPPTQFTPATFDFTENRFVFDYFSLHSALYAAPPTNTYPHFFSESEAHYSAPILSHKIVKTPQDGLRLIITASIPILPMYGFNASGIWNFVTQVSPDIVVN